jgi:DNA-binding NarL/FixJ family response regulator
MRVVIADDDQGYRALLREILEADGMTVTGEANDARQVVTLVEEAPPDIVLLDINMPGGGIQAAAVITAQHPGLAIVMVTGRDDDQALIDSLRAGAVGYLLKDTDPVALPYLLRAAGAGEPIVSARSLSSLIHYVRGRRGVRSRAGYPVQLSGREWEVMTLLREGRSTRDIALSMHVSPITVRRHISSVVEKLSVDSRAEALSLLQDDTR